MKPKCAQAVSKALGRTVHRQEQEAIEAHLLRTMRDAASRDIDAFRAQTPAARVMAAAHRLASDAITAAAQHRSALDARAPGPRRFAQGARGEAHRVALSFGEAADVESLRDLLDAGAPAEEILAHPIARAIHAHTKKEKQTLSVSEIGNPEALTGRRYVVDGEDVDYDAAIARGIREAESYVGAENIRAERRAVIVVGNYAAGKSTFIKAIARHTGAAVGDADFTKTLIPAFENGRNSTRVGNESSELRWRILEDFIAAGKNVVIENVGNAPGPMLKRIEWLRSEGYAVTHVHVKVEANEAVRRQYRRFLDGGRYIDPRSTQKVVLGGDVARTFDQVIETEGFGDYVEIDATPAPAQAIVARSRGAEALVEALRPLLADPGRRGSDEFAGGAEGGGGSAPGARGGEGLEQDGLLGVEERGETLIPEGGIFADPGVIVNLFETADHSTPFHEFGHVYLEMLHAYGARDDAPPALLADLAAVRRWLGAVDGIDLTTAQHEQFARGFEAYLREGRAPEPALQSIFDLFKKWLTDLYRTVTELDVDLDDEIRGVFDRLVKDPGDGVPRQADGRASGAAPRRSGGDAGSGDAGGAGEGGGGAGSGGGRDPAQAPAGKLSPRLLARDPELKAIADELAEARAELDALERQGRIERNEAAAARADLEVIEKTAARPELMRAAALCLRFGARVNPGEE